MAGINADYTAALKKGNWFSNLNNNYSSWAGGESFLGGGITNGALASAGMGVLNMGVNMLAGQNQTGIGNVMQTVGGLASNIPGVGGLIGAGVGVVGGLVNAAFGSHINEEFVNQTRNQANQIGSNVFNANTNADLLNDWGNLTEQSSVRKSEVGSDGWFSSKASRKTAELNRQIAEANRRQLANFNVAAENVDTQNDFRIMQNMAAYGGPINSFRKYYDKGGYLNQAKALIRQNEGWREKPYADAPKGKNWRSVGYGFNDSGFRDKYPEGISKHYEHGITKKQAEEELDYFLSKAEKQLKSIYGKQWNDFTDSQKAAILDTYYQRPASVGKSSRFYKAVTAGEDAGRYLGVAGYSRRNNIRQSVFGGAGFSGGAYEDDSKFLSYPSSILEATSPISELDLSGIEPTKVINPEINLSYPSLDLNFLTSSQKPVQQQVPTIGTVEDFLASYGDFEENLFEKGGNLYGGGGNLFLTGGPEGGGREEVTNLNTWDELAAQSPFLYTIGKALDPTGISGYGDAKEAITQYDTNPSVGNAYNAVMETLGALPIVSKAGKAIKFLQGAITGQGIFNDYNHAKEQQQKYGDELVVDYWDNTVKPRREAEKHAEQIKAKMSYGDVNHVPSFKLAPKDSKLGQIIHDYNDNHRVVKKYKKAFGGNLFEDGDKLNIKDMNIFDFGGGLTHGADFDTGINWVDEGGSHGENPLGGVPMGVDEQGIPNLVEEGEAIWNGDYVFSKRMKVPKKLREKYSLPDDATFADAVAKLTKNSDERPLSPIDRNTQNYILGEFADTQEEMRMAKAQRAMDRQQQLQDDFLMGMQFGLGGHMSPVGIVPDSDNVSLFDKLENSFADGGGIHIDPSKKGTFKAQASKMGMGVQEAASHILAHKENYSPAMVKKANFAKNFAHAFGGSLFDNPFGEANTFDFGGDLKTRRNTIMRNSGVTEEQANAMLFRMLSKEDRGRAIKERVFGTWTPTYNSNNEIVVPTTTTSNRGNVNGGISQSTGNSKTASQKPATKPKAASSVTFNTNGTNKYDRYLNGSDGFSTPWGFKVDSKGKATDYTPEYIAAANKLTVADINRYADEHPNDPSLQSFIRNNGGTREKAFAKLTDDYVRKGAQDGNYGFLHHVTDQIGKDQLPEFKAPSFAVPEDTSLPEQGLLVFDPKIMGNPEAMAAGTRSTITDPNGTKVTRVTGDGTSDNGLQRSPFKPKQTWTRYAPIAMNALFGLKEMLTPADYGNADAIMAAAYQAGAPVSVGTEYIGDYRKRDPFDERYLMNIINQRGNATNRNMMNLSGGNRAVAMSGILANDLTTQMALAEAARQAYLANRTDDAQVAEFNRGTNQFNATAQNQRNQFLAGLNSQRQQAMLSGISQGARLRQAIKDQRDAAISANLTNFAQGLGDLGKENGYYNMLGGLNEEGILKYFYGDDWKTKFNNVNV